MFQSFTGNFWETMEKTGCCVQEAPDYFNIDDAIHLAEKAFVHSVIIRQQFSSSAKGKDGGKGAQRKQTKFGEILKDSSLKELGSEVLKSVQQSIEETFGPEYELWSNHWDNPKEPQVEASIIYIQENCAEQVIFQFQT